MADEPRRQSLARGLRNVDERVTKAAESAGRDPALITTVVVTKTWPATDLRLLHELGVRDFGENRCHEGAGKAAELAGLDLTWHFIGQIQSNKATKVARYADVVHSVDSVRVAHRLSSGAQQRAGVVNCFIQVNLDPEGTRERRGGLSSDAIDEVADTIETATGLRLVGVMGVAPLGADPAPSYRRLADVSRRLVERHPGARAVSAGMSADVEEAIFAGATHVRVGSAVLGERPPLR
ncbi:MAG: YggS family pyridoxal phosphate-dependent enzyme [Nocardioidaceae bacterium]|nr:YggS family pyridoxal phosphate-dependent enzyme [Nocardioidaceae bacterium]